MHKRNRDRVTLEYSSFSGDDFSFIWVPFFCLELQHCLLFIHGVLFLYPIIVGNILFMASVSRIHVRGIL